MDLDNIINKDKSNIGEQFVRKPMDEILKEKIIKDATPKYREPEKITGSPETPETPKQKASFSRSFENRYLKNNTLNPIYKHIAFNIENRVSQVGLAGSIGEKTSGKVATVLARAPRYTGNIYKGINSMVNNVRYIGRLAKDINIGAITIKEAKMAALGRGKVSLKSGLKAGISASIRTIENFQGSEDIGIQAITKPKDMIFKTSKTIRNINKTTRHIRNVPKKVIKSIRNTTRRVQQLAQGAVNITRSASKLLTNIRFIKAILTFLIIAVLIITVIALTTSIASIFSSFTFVSTDKTLTAVSAYITRLDTDKEYDVINAPKDIKWAYIDAFKTTINIDPKTDVNKVLSYLTVKYGDFKFDQVKTELDNIINDLYKITYNHWIEKKKHPKKVAGIEIPWTETIHHLDITLDGITFDEYIENNKDVLFKKDEYSRYLTLVNVGGTIFRTELGSPFVGRDWKPLISCRYGWRIHPITSQVGLHEGIDIAMPAGTPINATMGGYISTGKDPNGLGNYVVVTGENKSTLYAHCSKIIITEGEVKKGNIIALVGSTGLSTGDHLHLEYMKNGDKLNPAFYLKN